VAVVLAALLSIAGPARALPPPPAPLSSSAASSLWSIQPSPNVNPADGALDRDSCAAGTTFCMSVGEQVGTADQYVPLVEIASATGWGVHSAPAPGGQSSDLTSMSCVSSTFCETTGEFDDSAGAHLFGAAWNGSRWALQSIPEPAGGGGSLWSISCQSTTFCEAVGNTNDSSGHNLVVERYNGSSWSTQSVPVPAGTTARALNDVSCGSATRCEAVGWWASSSAGGPLAVVFNGSTWTDQTIVGSGRLTGVSCWAAGACEAIGTDQQGNNQVMVQRLTSMGWKAQIVPDPPNSGYISTATISCTPSTCEAIVNTSDPGAPDVPFAVGWDGTSWQVQKVSTQYDGSDLDGVACSTASDCRAVGTTTFAGTGSLAVAANWNGTSWSPAVAANPVTRPYSSLAAVSCSAARACAAVGQHQTASGLQRTLAQRWNGTAWSTQTTANPGSSGAILAAVSCADASACTAVGNINDASAPLAESWSGGTWSLETVPAPPSFESGQFEGVSCTGPKACWASGWYIVKSGGYAPFAARWDGTGCHDYVLPVPTGGLGGQIYGISCHSANCTATGSYYDQQNYYPLADRWTGTAWVAQKMQSASGLPSLGSVSCPSTTWCAAIGADGSTAKAEHWNGTTWTIDAVPKPSGAAEVDLNAISCVSSTSCHAVGSFLPTDASFLDSRWSRSGTARNGRSSPARTVPRQPPPATSSRGSRASPPTAAPRRALTTRASVPRP
jgi:hypothetical protein